MPPEIVYELLPVLAPFYLVAFILLIFTPFIYAILAFFGRLISHEEIPYSILKSLRPNNLTGNAKRLSKNFEAASAILSAMLFFVLILIKDNYGLFFSLITVLWNRLSSLIF
jgi:hypothetical protein